MKIRDIVNRDIVTLTNCEHEPIHIPGSIQPHGFLLGLKGDHLIDFASENVAQYTGFTHTQLLGKTFAEIFGTESDAALRNFIKNDGARAAAPLRLAFNGTVFGCSIHGSGPHCIFEAEPYAPDKELLADVYTQTIQFVSYMNTTRTLRELCQLVAQGTREITGYDRVMVYRFDQEYNGEVFAESCRSDLEPFLGLHYPHTDIPVQARELYMKNLLRLIVDINYKPVPIFTIDDAPGKNLDLSLSVLRSTSPIHVEYLSNMGVAATLTISLIHRNRLWGLIACHHYSPKNLTPEIRLAAQLQGQFITSQIDMRQSNEEYEVARKTSMALEKMNAYILPPVAESFKILSLTPELLRLCNAAGVAIVLGDTVYGNGTTPPDTAIITLTQWLEQYSNNASFHTDKLINFVPDMKEVLPHASGVLYHSLGNGNAIIWFRPETVSEVHWGGDPEKAIIRDANGLHPRNSFNLWKQIVKSRSQPWLQPEIKAAANYAHSLQKQLSMMLMSREEERYRNLSEVLRETNSELENINWISTHDLQEPLRKIQLISSRMLTREDASITPDVRDALSRMNHSANRMQTLLVDILKYTRIKHTGEAFVPTDLNGVMDETLEDLKEPIRELSARVTVGALPKVTGIEFLLKQLFSNLIQNSLKYASRERPPAISVTASADAEAVATLHGKMCHRITFSDNGIGFEPKYAESIFNIFTRLHSGIDYKGSGVGLALCKKIMQAHQGIIRAEGKPGEGATVTLYFPCAFDDGKLP